MPDKVNAYLEAVGLFVIEENEQNINTVTSKPVEDGADISDHIDQEPITLNISFIVAKDGADVRRKLKGLRNSKEIYTYKGVNEVYNNMAIESLDIPINSDIKGGFAGSLKLKQVKIIEKQSSSLKLGIDPQSGQQIQADNNDTPKRELEQEDIPDDNTILQNSIGGDSGGT